MSKILAIKGHPTRGKEVIALLEMLGGINGEGYIGTNTWKDEYYFLDNDGYIHAYDWCDGIKFTLEEFLWKYPYKVGDKVVLDNKLCTVIWMCWECNNIYYTVHAQGTDGVYTKKVTADELNPYKEQDNMETTVETNKRDREDVLFDRIIWHLRNSVNNGKQHLSGGDCEAYFRELVKKVKMYKPVYPKTYKECCERVNACPTVGISYGSNKDMLYNDDVDLTLLALRKLLICRNAYWKIAGEQMGLGKPWKPNWSDTNEEVYGIQLVTDDTNMIYHESASFTFPTEEILNEFCKNFKDLIEKCKELL